MLALPLVKNCGIQEYSLSCKKTPEGRMKLARFNDIAYDMAQYAPFKTGSHSHAQLKSAETDSGAMLQQLVAAEAKRST